MSNQLLSKNVISWHLLGLGSVGGILASYWLKNQQKLTVILKDDHALAQLLVNRGLQFTQTTETNHFSLSQLNPELPHTLNTPITHLLLTVKAYDVLPALASIAHCFTNETQIYCFQNGLGVAEQIYDLYPQCRLYSVIASMGVYRLAPYHIKEAGEGHFWVGPALSSCEEDTATPHPKPQVLLEVFEQACLAYTWMDDIRSAQWQKLAVNCAINPLTVLYHCHNGGLLDNPEAKNTMMAICDEVGQVMTALKIPGSDAETLQQLALDVAKKTAANRSSMLQDHHKGRATEIDYLNGYLVDTAEKLGIPVPHNTRITKAIKAMKNTDCI